MVLDNLLIVEWFRTAAPVKPNPEPKQNLLGSSTVMDTSDDFRYTCNKPVGFGMGLLRGERTF